MREAEMFELLTRHDAEAIDSLRKVVDILKVYSTEDKAVELLRALWESDSDGAA